MDLKDIIEKSKDFLNKEITLNGWIRNHRRQKNFGFIDFSDGTIFATLQIVYDEDISNFNEITKMLVGSAIEVKGILIPSQGNQEFELKAKEINLLGSCPDDYPIQPKRHTREFLRSVAPLRPRSNLFQAVFRVRSVISDAIHTYFKENNYLYVHTPIITANDGEGAGEMFKVTTLDLNNVPMQDSEVDYKEDFFGKKVGLTVTGQLQGEAMAMAYKKIYTFGPTFRAEASHTKTHAAEFWMIEPEIAFCDLNELMNIIEDMLKYIIKYYFENAEKEIEFFNKFVETSLIERLNNILNNNAARITHKEAINILSKANVKWEFQPKQGEDIATEHEKYLTEVHFKSPVFITNWPKDIKAFYMRCNEDNKTVSAVDLLVPGSGELVGGSQREERYDVLLARMKELNMNPEELEWYTDLRKYGGCVHSGFGLGFERLLIYLTGVDNIRDVIPFPRTTGSCDF